MLPITLAKEGYRETLLQKLVLIMKHPSVRIRFRVIRTCLIVAKHLGYQHCLSNDVGDNDSDNASDGNDSFMITKTDNPTYYKSETSFL